MNGLQKFYIGLWTVFGLVIVVLSITGNLTMVALTVLGFVCFGLIFMGMMCVLPTTVGHYAVPVTVTSKAEPTNSERVTLRHFVNAWADPIGVELRQPKTH